MSNENSELGDLKKKFIEGFKQFEKSQQLIPIINSFIENFDKLLNPMYKTAVNVTTKMSIVFAVIFVLAYGVFGNYFVSLLTELDSIRDLAKEYLPWLVFIPLAGVWCQRYR